MAVITISAAGGNWNSTATWVGGVIPTTSDSILGDATSGQLTVNVNATIQFVDFTIYTNTLTINSNITLQTTTGTSRIGGNMSFNFLGSGATQGRLGKGSGAQTYTQTGTTQIPFFSLVNGFGILTLGSNLYTTNYNAPSAGRLDGNTLFINGNCDVPSNMWGTTIFRIIGTGTLNVGFLGSSSVPGNLIIDTSGGTTTIASQGLGIGNSQSNSNTLFSHLSGNIVNPIFRGFLNDNSIHTFNLISGTTWDMFGYLFNISTITLNFPSGGNFDKFILQAQNGGALCSSTLSGTTLNTNDFAVSQQFFNNSGTFTMKGIDVIMSTGLTINVASSIDINGGNNKPTPQQTPNIEIRSAVVSVPVNLRVNTFNQYVSRARFTDINCSGGNTLYGQNLTLTRTSNITQYTLPISAGGGSFTFVN